MPKLFSIRLSMTFINRSYNAVGYIRLNFLTLEFGARSSGHVEAGIQFSQQNLLITNLLAMDSDFWFWPPGGAREQMKISIEIL